MISCDISFYSDYFGYGVTTLNKNELLTPDYRITFSDSHR